MNMTTVYRTKEERVVRISNKRTGTHFVLLDADGRFIKEMPSDFCPVEYIKKRKER